MKASILSLLVVLGGCQQLDSYETFSRACATAGEAYASVIELRRAGKIDTETYNSLDDAYDGVVDACEDPSASNLTKVNLFLARISGYTGTQYPAY